MFADVATSGCLCNEISLSWEDPWAEADGGLWSKLSTTAVVKMFMFKLSK
jgi:hypothetical protein